MLKLALTLVTLTIATAAHAAPKTVCTVTINSSNERQSFQRNLPEGDFKFVELTDLDPKSTGEKAESKWFENACNSGIQCDVLVVSGHFGGMFFGSTGYQLTVPPLESRSCANSCDGILKHPKEVFLFGCNTLAEKDKDARTQQQYIDVLIHDGYRADVASQVAETRYGAVGSTFKDQMRRVFAGVPHIYGFHSVAPSGGNIAPALTRYFQSVPDYAGHLDQMGQTTTTNQQLAKAMADTSMTQTTGVGTLEADAGVPYRKQICTLYDGNALISTKTKTIVNMLNSDDRFIYLNSVVSFLNKNITAIRYDIFANEILNKVKRNSETMAKLDALEDAATTSLPLKLDLMELDVKLGLMTREEFQQRAVAIVKPLVHDLNQTNADSVCSAIHGHDLKISVTYDDIGALGLSRTAALYAMQCLTTTDERITAALLPKYDEIKRDGTSIRAYLLALTHVPGHNEEKIAIADQIIPYAPSLKTYAIGLKATAETDPAARLQDLILLTQMDVHEASLPLNVMMSLPRQAGLAEAMITSLRYSKTKQNYREQLITIVKTLPANSSYWGNVATEIAKQDVSLQATYAGYVAQMSQIPGPMVEAAIFMMTASDGFDSYFVQILGKAQLNPDQINEVANILNRSPNSGDGQFARWILAQQPQENLSKQIRKMTKGPAAMPICEVQASMLQCRPAKTWNN